MFSDKNTPRGHSDTVSRSYAIACNQAVLCPCSENRIVQARIQSIILEISLTWCNCLSCSTEINISFAINSKPFEKNLSYFPECAFIVDQVDFFSMLYNLTWFLNAKRSIPNDFYIQTCWKLSMILAMVNLFILHLVKKCVTQPLHFQGK